jgi:hypothetical protein
MPDPEIKVEPSPEGFRALIGPNIVATVHGGPGVAPEERRLDLRAPLTVAQLRALLGQLPGAAEGR